jgi:hypothetical protein
MVKIPLPAKCLGGTVGRIQPINSPHLPAIWGIGTTEWVLSWLLVYRQNQLAVRKTAPAFRGPALHGTIRRLGNLRKRGTLRRWAVR